MILETKLTLPQPKAGALLRTGLIELIKNNLDKKLILITAGAGYGKTTLLLQLIKAAKLPAIFYHLDQGDSDLLTFYSYLVTGLEQLSPGLAARSSGLLKQAEQIGNDHELLMGTLINELMEKRKEELFFVLDDYQHLAENSPVHQALDFFIDHMPESVHVIIASRAAVRFANYAKWYAKQNAFEVRRSDLRFSEDDVQELLTKSFSQALGPDDLKSLLEHTEGWITGIQLILANIHGAGRQKTVQDTLTGFLETKQQLFQYFTAEILEQEDDKTNAFLRQTSIFNEPTPGLCDYVFGSSNSEDLLEKLVKRNLFISALGNKTYRFHNLFREYLLNLCIDKQAMRRLHDRAAEYYLQSNMTEEAVNHFLEAGNNDRAASIISDTLANTFTSGKITLLDGWLRLLPDSCLKSWPMLVIHQGLIKKEQGDLGRAKDLYRTAEELLIQKRKTGHAGRNDIFILAFAMFCRGNALFMERHFAEALKTLFRALQLCRGSRVHLKSNILNTIGLIEIDFGLLLKAQRHLYQALQNRPETATHKTNIALLLYKKGDIKSSCSMYREIVEQYKSDYHLSIGVLYANAANAAMVRGDLEWAGQLLQQGASLCSGYADALSQAALLNSRASLAAYRGYWPAAENSLEQAVLAYKNSGWAFSEAVALLNMIRLYRYNENRARAGECLARAGARENDVGYSLRTGLQIERAFYELGGHNSALAGKSFRTIMSRAQKSGFLLDAFVAGLGLAAACLSAGRRSDAKRLLRSAILTSLKKGYDGLLAQELRCHRKLHDFALASNIEQAYLCSLDQRFARPGDCHPEAGAFKIKMLGGLQVILPGGDEMFLKFPTRKETSLFTYLLLHRDRVCHLDELVNNIWPKEDPEQAVKNIYSSISLIKKSFLKGLRASGSRAGESSPVIIYREKGYRFLPAFPCRIDVEELREQFESARHYDKEGNIEASRQSYENCLKLYGGDFLTSQDDLWCEEPRRSFEKTYLVCLKKTAEGKLENMEYGEAAELYQEYLGRDAYDEQAHIGYWQALKELGRRDDIQKDYKGFKKLIKKELGVEPGEKIRKLFDSFMLS